MIILTNSTCLMSWYWAHRKSSFSQMDRYVHLPDMAVCCHFRLLRRHNELEEANIDLFIAILGKCKCKCKRKCMHFPVLLRIQTGKFLSIVSSVTSKALEISYGIIGHKGRLWYGQGLMVDSHQVIVYASRMVHGVMCSWPPPGKCLKVTISVLTKKR